VFSFRLSSGHLPADYLAGWLDTSFHIGHREEVRTSVAAYIVPTELDRLNAEMDSLLHRRQPTVLSLLFRLLFGHRYAARFDRCQRRKCRARWGRDGCEPHRAAEGRLIDLEEATQEYPTVVVFHQGDPEAILAVIR